MRPSFQPVANDVALKCLPTREDRSVVRCSIQLSYGRKNPILPKKTPSNAAVTCCFTCMVGNFISRRHGGRERLTIFASSHRQTLESAHCCSLRTNIVAAAKACMGNGKPPRN